MNFFEGLLNLCFVQTFKGFFFSLRFSLFFLVGLSGCLGFAGFACVSEISFFELTVLFLGF